MTIRPAVRRSVATATCALVVLCGFAPAANSAPGGGQIEVLTITPTGGSESCAPVNFPGAFAWASTPTYQCRADVAFGENYLQASIFAHTQGYRLGDPLPGVYPGTPVPVEARGTVTARATHQIRRSVKSAVYTWRLRPRYLYAGLGVAKGTALHRGAFSIAATHDRCARCSATARRLLVGSDEPAGAGTYRPEGWSYTAFEVIVTVRNESGDPVPPGTVTLDTDFEGVVSWTPDPVEGTWVGWGRVLLDFSSHMIAQV